MADANPDVSDDCRDRFDHESLVEACKLGAKEAAGAGEINVDIRADEGDLPNHPDDASSEIYGDFTATHSSTAHFANVVEPKLDNLQEELAEDVGTEPWAVSQEVTEAYYYGAGEQIEEEVEEAMDDRF